MTRNDGRNNNQIRPVEFVLDYVDYPEGSTFSREVLNMMLEYAESGIQQLISKHISDIS